MAEHSPCGIIHGKEPSCEDTEGCILPEGHDGPHEFISTAGEAWQWETDLECDCEWCMQAEGDWCTTYWRKDARTSSVGNGARDGGGVDHG